MTTREKLKAIKAKCEALLAIAEKRTPGKWEAGNGAVWYHRDESAMREVCEFTLPQDALFIASCAGPAEAGWKATIAAIDALLEIYDDINESVAFDIINAWQM